MYLILTNYRAYPKGYLEYELGRRETAKIEYWNELYKQEYTFNRK